MQRFDAVIAGGSLAGSAAGIVLAGREKKVLILEKEHFPRPKVCGEFLSPGVWPLLRELGVEDKILRTGNPIGRAEIHFPSGRRLAFELPKLSPDMPAGLGLSRSKLDRLLLERARSSGCTVREGCRFEGAVRCGSHFKIRSLGEDKNPTEEITAAHFIDASGRKPAGAAESGRASFGFKAHFHSISGTGAVELYYFPGGYLGLAGIEDGLTNVCGLAGRKLIAKTRGRGELILEAACEGNRSLARRLAGARRFTPWLFCGPLRHGGGTGRRETGVLHAGDAACFLEPFMGQGMTLALAGGILTAKLAAETGGNLSEPASRQGRLLEHLYRRRLRIGSLPAAIMPGSPLSSTLNHLSSCLPFVWKLAVHAVCAAPYGFGPAFPAR